MISFQKMRVRTRLAAAGVAVFAGLALISGYTLVQIKEEALAAHSERIKHLVEVASGIIGNYRRLETDRILTREQAQTLAKDALRGPRFGSDDYFFIYDYDGRALMVAGKPAIEGQVLLGKTDAAGFLLWDALVERGKVAGRGYFDYVFPRAGQTVSKPKRGYVMGIPEWQWIVGTGVYIDDVDAAVSRAAARYGALSLLVLAVVAAISLRVSRSIIGQLGGEPQDAAEAMRRIANGDLGVDIALAKNDNGSLMASLKLMQMKLKNITAAIQDNALVLNEKISGFEKTARSYAQSRSEDDLAALSRSVGKLGKSADMLEKSIARFRQ